MTGRLRPALGLPYARVEQAGRRIFMACPRCGKTINLADHTADGAISKIEYSSHYYIEHAQADGLVRRAGVWYEIIPN